MAWMAVADRPAEATSTDAGLLAQLRAATAEAHQRLEDRLDLLRAPVSARRIAGAIEGFWGFHSVWEPAMDAQPVLAPLWSGRARRAAIRADLMALGRDAATIAALPRCEPAAALANTPWRALGALYVLEGSTLGGQVIARALAGQPWLPPGGLRTFNPYGAETGARWRAFRAGAEALAPAHTHAAVIDGALDAFALLADWLPRRLAA